jgi:adenosylcobinamide-GDP ribazoletransferase
MEHNDISLTRWCDISAGFALLTRLPLRASDAALERGARAAWGWPLIGAVLGALAGAGAGDAMLALPAGPGVAAGVMLGAQAMLTGAMHEDGLADTADGFWGGWDPARRLAIMKDSHIGSYGVMALMVARAPALDRRWRCCCRGAHGRRMLAVGALSRAPMAVLMAMPCPPRAKGGCRRPWAGPAKARHLRPWFWLRARWSGWSGLAGLAALFAAFVVTVTDPPTGQGQDRRANRRCSGRERSK